MNVHKEQHTILERLNDHGYNGLDYRTKVTRLVDNLKVDSLNTVKERILTNSDFCKDFDKCANLYKDFLKHSESIPNETRLVSEVSSGVHGGSGVENVEDRYYTKEE